MAKDLGAIFHCLPAAVLKPRSREDLRAMPPSSSLPPPSQS
jgi:hypothetical protein